MNYTEEIDRYICGELNESELCKFKEKVNSNPDLALSIEEYKKLHADISEQIAKLSVQGEDSLQNTYEDIPEFLELSTKEQKELATEIDKMTENPALTGNVECSEDEKAFRDMLREVRMTNNKEEKAAIPKKKQKVWYRLAAIFILAIIGGITYLLISNRSYSGPEIFTSYYEPYERNIQYRSGADDNKLLSDALQSYMKHDYVEALVLFDQIPKTDLNEVTIQFYSAISLIETNNINDAMVLLQQIVELKDSSLVDRAQWYLALCYLKTEQTAEAVKILSALSKTETLYARKSTEVLQKLDR